MEGWPGWVDLGGWLHTEMVTYPSTNRAWCWLTSLMQSTMLPTEPDHPCRIHKLHNVELQQTPKKRSFGKEDKHESTATLKRVSEIRTGIPVTRLRSSSWETTTSPSFVIWQSSSSISTPTSTALYHSSRHHSITGLFCVDMPLRNYSPTHSLVLSSSSNITIMVAC